MICCTKNPDNNIMDMQALISWLLTELYIYYEKGDMLGLSHIDIHFEHSVYKPLALQVFIWHVVRIQTFPHLFVCAYQIISLRVRKQKSAYALLTNQQQRHEKPSRAAQPFILTLDGFSWICYLHITVVFRVRFKRLLDL